ncbi:bifunctional hydroxymethylpyrimidine kinase/phosphomethylpyrimidine kinase [Butyrivibrio sp. INlla21]|uniref:bifunctional hydroxymethylpyrimidine kinase/phosphomethylpyrimidine kinase n=1 Tax=Butyrivibrio sp. INlla21 TaxID=1520811 RepID=UPI0008F2E6D5|nr:bifunctional hydroxymethylpyrimidine kinase/phosphomethylpyrimidine kinase [Butyrivibrio sp. INlla21]SFU85950.1 pyridoxine kinase [Butyrivibrio sp. INlla21]
MRVAAVNDLSGFGKCSLLADISVLSSMGIEVCPVPTAVLTAQTGFSSYYMHDTGDMVQHSKEEWSKMGVTFDGVLTGYMPSEEMAGSVLDFVNTFNREGAVLLVDPVMGDGGKCYSNYSDAMLAKIKDLAATADIITPNLTEACLLAGAELAATGSKAPAGESAEGASDTFASDVASDEIAEIALKGAASEADRDRIVEIARRARAHAEQTVVVTGIPGEGDELYNLVVYGDKYEYICGKTNGRSYSGTGDLFAALLLGNILNGLEIVDAVKAASSFICEAIAATTSDDRNYGVDFEKVLRRI